MRYLLDEDLRLRGWDRLPYAVAKVSTGSVTFVRPDVFGVLQLCDGTVDFDVPLVTNAQRDLAQKLVEEGTVVPCEAGAQLRPGQAYHRYPCRRIRTAHWSITGRCNYRCKHCYMDAPDARLGELGHEEIMDIARQLGECGVSEATLTGGEPLVRRDFMGVVDALLGQGIRIVQIYSNGRLVTRELLEQLQERGIAPEFNMSYDGTQGWHDWLRGIDGAEKFVLDAFDLCHEMGFPTGAELCLHKGNRHLLRESLNTLAAHHCASVKTNPVADSAAWARYSKDYTLTMEETYGTYLDYVPRFFEDGMPLSVMLGGFFSCGRGKTNWRSMTDKFDDEAQCLKFPVCGHARQTLYISPEGRMLPCMPLSSCDVQDEFPSILDAGLAAGLTDSRYLDFITMTVGQLFERNAECAACEHRISCAGGCRASALMDGGGSLLGPDRAFCTFFKQGYRERLREVADAAIAEYVPDQGRSESQQKAVPGDDVENGRIQQ